MAYCAYCGSYVAQVSMTPCASCGRPTNGAPPAPRGGGSNVALVIVFVVLGALGVVFVIGILAAIAIPNLLTAMERSRQKRTMADMRQIASAIERYAAETRSYPAATSMTDLQRALVPRYAQQLPALDGWGEPLQVAPLEDGYVIASSGRDKQFELESPLAYEAGPTSHFDCDIVFSNGSFVQYPEGTQRGGDQ